MKARMGMGTQPMDGTYLMKSQPDDILRPSVEPTSEGKEHLEAFRDARRDYLQGEFKER